MPKPKVEETFVYKHIDKGYVNLKLRSGWTGIDWHFKWVPSIRDAWRGCLPKQPRVLQDEDGNSLGFYWDDVGQVHVRVSTTIHFELIPEKNKC